MLIRSNRVTENGKGGSCSSNGSEANLHLLNSIATQSYCLPDLPISGANGRDSGDTGRSRCHHRYFIQEVAAGDTNNSGARNQGCCGQKG